MDSKNALIINFGVEQERHYSDCQEEAAKQRHNVAEHEKVSKCWMKLRS